MYIFKYILKRLALMLFVFFVIITMCFVLVKLLPSMPVESFGKDMELVLTRRELLGQITLHRENGQILYVRHDSNGNVLRDENGEPVLTTKDDALGHSVV